MKPELHRIAHRCLTQLAGIRQQKVRGSAHVAVGDSFRLGETVRSDLHRDGMLLNPTVLVDGPPVVSAGELVLGDAFEVRASSSLQLQGGTT